MAVLKSYSRLAVLAERERIAKHIESMRGDGWVTEIYLYFAKCVRGSGDVQE